MVDLLDRDNLVPVSEVLPCLPYPVSRTTVLRWCREGVRGERLRHIRVGQKVLTTPEAVEDFIARINGEVEAA